MARDAKMMLVFISCTKLKRSVPCKALEMYSPSTLFKLSLKYARKLTRDDNIYVLSAKYGLIKIDTVIKPYDETLNKMTKSDRLRWSERVFKQFLNRGLDETTSQIIFLTGKRYHEFLIHKFEKIGIKCFLPLEGMGIGMRLKWLSSK